MTRNEIKLISSIRKTKQRNEHGLFIVEGIKMVKELVTQQALKIHSIYVTEESLFKELESIKNERSEAYTISNISEYHIKRIGDPNNPQRVLAVVHIPEWKIDYLELLGNLTIALDYIQNPGNLGTIIRTADWFGIKNIICSNDSVDVFNPKVIKATMGSIFRVKVHYLDLGKFFAGRQSLYTNNPSVLIRKKYEERGLNRVYGAMVNGENIYETDLQKNGIILLGNEGNGISPGLHNYINTKIAIPSFSSKKDALKPESLNIAAAAAVLCSEFRRRVI